VCDNVTDCNDDTTQCLPAAGAWGEPIPGLGLCVANCNPMEPSCGVHANCVYLSVPPLFDCAASLDHGDGDSCSVDTDCAAGLLCRSNTCRPWCDTPGDVYATCKSLVWCCAIDPAPSYAGTELGYCACAM
jgi:hypothetical protein